MRFVLVHGGFHGAWCWSKMAPHLEARGHEVVAVDLPGAGKRLREKATLGTWRGALREVIDDGDVVVGHSLGGFAISLAADEVPDKVARLVYLSATAPVEGLPVHGSLVDDTQRWPEVTGLARDSFLESVELPEQGPCLRLQNARAAAALFYHDCTPEDQAWAFDHLTPLAMAPTLEPLHLPRFWAAPIPRDFIVCLEDRSHSLPADNEYMRRLGITTAFGILSSHSPFISCPAETARILDVCARGSLA